MAFLSPLRLNSLPVKLLALFGLVFLLTVLLAFGLGLSVARRSVEEEIRSRTAELTSATTYALRRAQTDDDSIAEELTSVLRMNRGILNAELARAATLGLDADFHEARTEPDGIWIRHWRGPAPGLSGGPQLSAVVEIAGQRALRITQPFTDPRGRRLRLTLLASLQEAERVTLAERTALLRVALGAALFLSVALWQVVSVMLVRRVRVLENSMRAVQEGNLEVQVPVDAKGGDELTFLSRGFNKMVEQIRDFNAELTRKIDDATSKLKSTNEQLVIMQRDLTAKERLAALGQLGGTIAHELGNPLNALSGQVQLLSRRQDLPEGMKDKLHQVAGEVTRMTQIIRRFLDQTRGFTPVSENVQLEVLLDEAIDLTVGQEQRSRIAITREVEAEARRVRVDAGLVRHLLVNLIANGVDSMPQGGKLDVRARREAGELVLSVADTGMGMPPEVRRHVFEPFYTTKAAGKGTGLGLSICKEIARAFKGRIDVESEPGKGTTFTVRFPAEAWQEAVA